MADIKAKYGTSTAITLSTESSLADGAMRQSTEIDNTGNLFLDCLVGGKITTGTGPTDQRSIVFYVFGTVDGGTIRTGGAGATDAAFTGEENSLFFLGAIPTDNTNDHVYEYGPFSVASAFGGTMPDAWGVIVKNNTGVTLNTNAANHDHNYQGYHLQTV